MTDGSPWESHHDAENQIGQTALPRLQSVFIGTSRQVVGDVSEDSVKWLSSHPVAVRY